MRLIRWGTLAVLGLGVVLASTTACNPFGEGKETVTQQVVEVTRGNIVATINGDGNIESSRNMKLSFGTSGKISKIYFKEGDKVSQEAVLAKLDTGALELALTQAQVSETQAQLGVTQAQVNEVQAKVILAQAQLGVTQAEVILAQAQLGVTQAEVALETAKFNLDRMKDVAETKDDIEDTEYEVKIAEMRLKEANYLGEDDAATRYWRNEVVLAQIKLAKAQQDLAEILDDSDYVSLVVDEVIIKQLQVKAAEESLEMAKLSVKQAQQSLEVAKLSLEQVRQSLEVAKLSVKQAQQSLKQALQSREQAQKQLDEATITAPFAGVIAEVYVDEGDTVSSTTNVIHLVDPNNLELTVELDEIDIPQAKLNQPAIIRIDALPDARLNGKITTIYPVPNTVGGAVLYKVKIKLDVPPDSALKIGMSASADIIIAKRENVLLVPNRAIGERQGNPQVKVMLGNQIVDRQVVTGITDGTQTEIVSGLNEGEQVIIETRVKPQLPGGGLFGG